MKKAIGKEAYLLGEMPIRKAYWSMAIPAILAMIARAVYSAVDTAYIGMMDNKSALAAVGIVFPILLILNAFETTLAQGVVVLVGRKLGSKEKEAANTVVSTVFATSIGIGMFFCAFGFIFMNPMLRLFGASEAVISYARDYSVWLFIGMLFNMPANALNNSARGESAVKVASTAMIIGMILNVVIDPVFIFDWGLGMGVAGASLATTLSQMVSFGYVLSFYLRKKSLVRIKRSAIKPTAALYKMLIGIGLPVAVFQLSLSLSIATTNKALVGLAGGDNYVAAYSVAQKTLQAMIMVFLGLLQGLQPIAAFSIGAGNENRFRETITYVMKIMLIVGIVMSLAFWVFAGSIMNLFSSDLAVVTAGIQIMRSQTVTDVLFGIVVLMMMAFQILGKTKQSIFMSLIRQVIIYVPLVTLLPIYFDYMGVLIAPVCADIFAFIVSLLMLPILKKTMAAIKKDQ
ncbi:MAG: MATE family efflux transporter [Synergistaceae bacterium]|jgi:putative MATE family efflux protein|nr:MATE family efflux transporter [Synergistaceae bacterium]